MDKSDILKIYSSKNTVFTFKDISLIWGETETDLVKSKINYYVKTGKLYAIRRGIYAKDKNYDRLELGTKIYTPSYVSLQTILEEEGIIFQYHKSIFVISYQTREITCGGNRIVYKKIKDIVLSNKTGLEKMEGYFVASKERAFLDTLYLYGEYYFDNLKPIKWDLCFQILPIYKNKNLAKRLKKYAGHK
ncbi:MAG: hypothetical protein HYY52_00215 [Candidatus Melainabacteria bacterium]|nr:hypothetical protein [Candidatus Melainabacteria bacterium]